MITVTAEYDSEGKISTLTINYKGECISVLPYHDEYSPTRELQRADEIVQALTKYSK